MVKAILLALGLAIGGLGGYWLGAREKPSLRAEIAELQKRPERCAPSGLAQLGDALAMLQRARPAPPSRPLPAPIQYLPEPHSDFVAHVEHDDARSAGPPDGGMNLLAVAGKLSGKSADALARLKQQVELTDDQEKLLKAGVDDMNTRVGQALDKLVSLPERARSRDLAAIGIDALGALKDADETFRAALTADQRATLDQGDFDIASQLDPLLLLHFLKRNDAH